MKYDITYHVKMDKSVFTRFALFDTLIRKRAIIRPLVFALIFSIFAIICFISGMEQSVLIGTVLLIVGIGLPLVYIGFFLSTVHRQVKLNRLDKPRAVYTVHLQQSGIFVMNDARKEDPRLTAWENVYRAYLRPHCIYLYAEKDKAFLLPEGQSSSSLQETWAYLCSRLPAEAVYGKKG